MPATEGGKLVYSMREKKEREYAEDRSGGGTNEAPAKQINKDRGESHEGVWRQGDSQVSSDFEEHAHNGKVRNGDFATSRKTGIEDRLQNEAPNALNAEHSGEERCCHAEFVAQVDRIAGIIATARPGRAELQEETKRHDRLEVDSLRSRSNRGRSGMRFFRD